MLSLDDEDLIGERLIGSVDNQSRRRFNLRPLLTVLAVLVLGGALGGGIYMLSNLDTRDVIGALDVADQPRLTLPVPARPHDGRLPPLPPLPGNGGGPLLSPPGGAPGLAGITPPTLSPAVAPPAAPPAAAKPAAPPPQAATASAPAPAPMPTPPAPAAMPDQPVPGAAYQAPTYASLPNRATPPKPLPPAPQEALVRQSAYGLLPVVPRDGRLPWKTYAAPFDAPPGAPRVSVVVSGLGLDKDATDAAITKLPGEVTLAFSPYAGGLDKWVKKARDFGHEVMLMLPAEPVGFPARDPGPWGLLVNNPPEENISRLEQVLARAPGAVGVLAPDGAFVRSAKLSPVLAALKERGMIFVGDGARVDVDLPVAAVTTTLDIDLFRDAIEARLSGAARTAKERGSGLVVVSPRPVAFDRLVGWLDRLHDQGLVLAPATGIVKQTGKQ